MAETKLLRIAEETRVVGYLPPGEDTIEAIAEMVEFNPLHWPEQALETDSEGIVGKPRRVLINVIVRITELPDKDL